MSWITLGDRLPKENEQVLAFDHGQVYQARLFRSGHSSIWRTPGGVDLKNVAYWMPLPDAPDRQEKGVVELATFDYIYDNYRDAGLPPKQCSGVEHAFLSGIIWQLNQVTDDEDENRIGQEASKRLKKVKPLPIDSPDLGDLGRGICKDGHGGKIVHLEGDYCNLCGKKVSGD